MKLNYFKRSLGRPGLWLPWSLFNFSPTLSIQRNNCSIFEFFFFRFNIFFSSFVFIPFAFFPLPEKSFGFLLVFCLLTFKNMVVISRVRYVSLLSIWCRFCYWCYYWTPLRRFFKTSNGSNSTKIKSTVCSNFVLFVLYCKQYKI